MQTAIDALRWLLSAGLAANGLAMLLAPGAWYATVPGVALTGALNTHFVRDIGCAYLVSAAGLAWRALRPATGTPPALLGAAFLALHAGVHLGEFAAGICGWRSLARDVPDVVLPALLALALAGPPSRTQHPGRTLHA